MTTPTDPAAVFAAAEAKLAAMTDAGVANGRWASLMSKEDCRGIVLAVTSASAALDLGRAATEMGQVFARFNGVWTGWDDNADEVVERFRAALDAYVAALAQGGR